MGQKQVSASERLKVFARYAGERACVLRSLKVALVVGTVLAFINHFDAILSGSLDANALAQMLVTYLVPYTVATYGSASQGVQMELGARRPGVLTVDMRARA